MRQLKCCTALAKLTLDHSLDGFANICGKSWASLELYNTRLAVCIVCDLGIMYYLLHQDI